MIDPDLPLPLALAIASVAVGLIVALRYLVSSGLFAWVTGKVHPGLYADRRAQIAREIRWSLVAAAIYGAPFGVIYWGWQHQGWTLIYSEWTAYPLWYAPISIAVYLFAQDSWFYWTHRSMHQPKLFRAMHAVHHDSRPPTAWTAMSFHPLESISGAVLIPVMVFVVPIHLGSLAVVLTVATIMGVTNHMGWEMFPRWLVHSRLGKWVITASHHERHHEEYQCNFGLYFRFWDRVCETDKGLSQRMVEEREA